MRQIVALDLIRRKLACSFKRGTVFFIDDRHWTPLTLSWEKASWSPQDDLSLLIGIAKYGWDRGAIHSIFRDVGLRLCERLTFTGLAKTRLDQDLAPETLGFLRSRLMLLVRSLHIERQYEPSYRIVEVPDSDHGPYTELFNKFSILYNQGLHLKDMVCAARLTVAEIQPLFSQLVDVHAALIRYKRARGQSQSPAAGAKRGRWQNQPLAK